MEQFVGLDVSQKFTHVCAVNREGAVVWRGTCISTPEEIAATIRTKAPHVVRIGLETGPLSTWSAREIPKRTNFACVCWLRMSEAMRC